MKHYRFLVPVLAALALFLVACAPPPELRDVNLLQDRSLVTGEPCAAPCWRGIIPGETRWADALTLLEDDTTLENLQTRTDEGSSATAADWQPRGGTACCQMFSEDGETVSLLFLRTAPGVTLGEVIRVYDDPFFAVGSPFSEDQAIVNLIFPSVPMVVYAFVPGTEGDVSASSEIIGVLYMTAADMDLLVATSNLHAWDGFGAFQTYGEEANYEVTPSITLTPTPAS